MALPAGLPPLPPDRINAWVAPEGPAVAEAEGTALVAPPGPCACAALGWSAVLRVTGDHAARVLDAYAEELGGRSAAVTRQGAAGRTVRVARLGPVPAGGVELRTVTGTDGVTWLLLAVAMA